MKKKKKDKKNEINGKRNISPIISQIHRPIAKQHPIIVLKKSNVRINKEIRIYSSRKKQQSIYPDNHVINST